MTKKNLFIEQATFFELNEEQREAEILRQEFVTFFNIDRLARLTLEEYAIGQANKNNLCYWIERRLHNIGSMLGSTSKKFGVYYEKRTQNIKWTRWTNHDFSIVRSTLLDLYMVGENLDLDSIRINPLSPMFKAKILCVYFPERYLNIFTESHLKFFLDKLGVAYEAKGDFVYLHGLLFKYKESECAFSSWSAVKFGHYLYSFFGEPPKKEVDMENLSVETAYDNEQNIKVDQIISRRKRVKKSVDIPLAKPKLFETAIGITYKRDNNKKVQAIVDAGYSCEIDLEHQSFLRRDGVHKYTEAHHLIPMTKANQDRFDHSLDIPANIVSLCSNCHNCLHYGANSEELLRKLFNKRQERLRSAGIEIAFEDLLDLYR